MACDVLIVGAGPTGLTLAVDLARRGVAFRLVEKQPAVAGSRGKGLQPRTLEVLDDLGVIDEILATGETYPQIRVYAGRLPVWRAYMHKKRSATPEIPYPMTIMQPQWRTERILRDRLAALGGSVESGVEVTGFDQDDDGVTVHLRGTDGESTERVRYLVGADGGRSTVRKTLGVGFLGETRDEERMVLGDVRVEGVPADAWRIWLGVLPPRFKVALCPLPHTGQFQLTSPLKPGAEPDLTLAGMRKLVSSAVPGARVTELTWSSLYRVNIRMVDRYRVGRAFLAGDAVHVHSPAGGQGLNTGVQDAYNLGWKLARVLAGGPESLLDTYQEERLPVAAHVLGLSTELLNRAAKGSLKRGEDSDQLGITYRGLSLAGPGGGDRAPDGVVRTRDGASVRLFDAYRGPHATLLASAPLALAGVSTVDLDSPYRGHRFTLVRPDGYVAVASDAEEDVVEHARRM